MQQSRHHGSCGAASRRNCSFVSAPSHACLGVTTAQMQRSLMTCIVNVAACQCCVEVESSSMLYCIPLCEQVLTPINDPWDFFASLDPGIIPHLANPSVLRRPELLQRPASHAAPSSMSEGVAAFGAPWLRCPPTFHAFGWIYRRRLMQYAVQAFDAHEPPFNPLDGESLSIRTEKQ